MTETYRSPTAISDAGEYHRYCCRRWDRQRAAQRVLLRFSVWAFTLSLALALGASLVR